MAAMLELFEFADPFPFAFEVLLHISAAQLSNLVEQQTGYFQKPNPYIESIVQSSCYLVRTSAGNRGDSKRSRGFLNDTSLRLNRVWPHVETAWPFRIHP